MNPRFFFIFFFLEFLILLDKIHVRMCQSLIIIILINNVCFEDNKRLRLPFEMLVFIF